ncbi:zinc finger protein 69 homolog [Periophthalmus magnuspinnatus]|uniref:zinc finger protein 69 homolog n=1 Tax=Periophthalmus magnuspinnatus TaxID=409849 RepID=UPI002436C0EE|nr:zinc finger protein 69 homolog [Periophthalmus magnuspinnatus]
MSKGLALLEQSLLKYDEERLRARLPLDSRAMLQKRDVNTLSMSPKSDSSPEMVKKEDDQVPMELPFNTVIVKNECDAKERRGEDEGEESEDEEEEEESEDEEEESEEEEPGCSSETKGLVFSSFDSDSEEWEPAAKRQTEETREAADGNDTKQKGIQPFVIKRDIGSFVFHNCTLKENRNSRLNEPHRERTREKDKPGCSTETTTPQTNTTNLQPAPQNAPKTPQNNNSSSNPTTIQSKTASQNIINTEASEVHKSPAKRKKTQPNPDGEVVKTTKHKCAECGKYFQCEAHLQRHMLIHYGLKPFECPVCDKAFRYKSSYKAHLNMHTEEKPLSCSICDKGFTQSRDLKRHMLSHTDEKNFDCPECGGKFKHKHNLIRHISVIHKAEKPYPCPMCDKAFAQKHDFMTHMRTHSGEKPFTCNVCTRSFGAKGTLRTHMKVHKKTGSKDQEELSFETGDESVSDL